MGGSVDMFYRQTVIPAISNHQDLKKFLTLDIEYGILMNFQLAQLEGLVKQMKEAGKKVLIHAELIKGLSADEFGAIFLIQTLRVDGIISSKPKAIETCRKRGVLGILRFFLKDSISLAQSLEIATKCEPDFLEVLPATTHSVLHTISKSVRCPILLGGLIQSKTEIAACLKAGAIAVTTSNPDLWL